MSKSRVQTGQTPRLFQDQRISCLFIKKKRFAFSLIFLSLLLTSLVQAGSVFPPNSEIYQEGDATPRTSSVSEFEHMRLDKLRDQRSDVEGAHPRVRQTPSCRQVASTTPNYDCITETWKICGQAPQDNKTCIVSIGYFSQDTVIELSEIENLVVIEELKCLVMSTQQQCSITIRLTKPGPTSVRVLNKGIIRGKFVIIDSPETGVFVGKESKIIAGGSYSHMGSSSGNEPLRGASFVGEGGYCGTEDIDYRVYGKFDMSNPDNPFDPEIYQAGSMAEWDPIIKSTSGGGYIYMNVDSTHFEGDGKTNTIEAIGWPSTTFTQSGTYHGGSGGYIHIKTSNIYGKENNPNNQDWRISAFGGNGRQHGFGGSGGIIIIDGKFGISQNNYLAYGGKAGDMVENSSGCGTGAAGTVYYKQIDFLYISNGNRKTNKKTYVQAKLHPQSSYPEENMVAKILWVEGRANVAIQNTAMDSIIFPLVRVEDASTMIFDFKETNQLTIMYTSTFSVDSQSTIDTTSIVLRTRFKSYDPNEDSYLQLGKLFFSGDIDLEASQVELQQSLVDPSIPLILDNSQNGRMIILADQIHIMDNVELKAPNIFMYANKSITIMPGSKIQSLKAYECNTRNYIDWIPKMFKCMSNNYDKSQLSYQDFLSYYNDVHNTNIRDINSMVPTILYWWNIYIMTGGKLTIYGTKVLAPKVGLCGSDISLSDTLVDTSWKGCPHDKGIGSIARYGDCAGPGAAHGGDGGFGGLDRIDRLGEDTLCRDHFPKARYDGKEAAYEGSGGTSGDDMKQNGGSGGGVIWSHTPGTTTMEQSSFKANGQSGRLSQAEQVGSGGGAGGSIYITTLNMVGDGLVSAMGGAGLRGGGGGSGGRFIMNYLKSYLSSSNPKQSFYWVGHHDVSGGVGGAVSRRGLSGQTGELGTAYHTKCFPGYEGVFCKACEIGTYKYDYSYGECQPCINKPQYSSYTMKAEDSAQCDYECDKLLESSKYNPDCLDPIRLEIQRLGGMIPFFALLGLFLIFSLIIFSMLSYRSQQMNEEIKDLPEVLYYVWEDSYQSQINVRGRTQQLDYSMNDDCVWSHTHRMYLIGSNTINYPFFIPKDFPRDALKKSDREKLLLFIDQVNVKLRYTLKERIMFIIVYALYPPLANHLHLHLRKKKFTMLQDELYHHFPPQFWGDKTDNKTIRLGVSKADYMMAYIDFLDFGQTRQNWEGIKLPMAILLAGNGTFNNPYNIDFQTDVFAKSLVLLRFDFFREKLPIWLQNFNTQLSKLSFYKLEVTVMRDLTNVVEWIEKANLTMFNHFDVKAVLYVIENQYTEIDGGQFKQKRRSFPLETIFFDAFPEMYLNLIRYVKQRLITGKSEIRIALVFKKQSKAKLVQTEMRIKMMKEKDNQSAYQTAINRQESVLFDDTDKDADEDRVKFESKRNSNEGQPLQSSTTIGTADSNATFQSDASTSSGDKKNKKAVKLVNKTLRAFSISIESSKAFELTIRKPRRKCKHYFTRFKAQIYSIYLLLIKQQGSSPKSKDLTFFFILYACMLALDLLLLLNYTLHIFFPSANFTRFGWAFCFFVMGVPYISPAMAFTAAFFGSPELMKVMSNFNSYEILINIPLVAFISALQDEDPVYYLLLQFMILVKMGLSATSAKVRQYLTNPRYSKNSEKLKKILKRQKEKIQKREDILGREATQELAQSQVEQSNVSTTSSLLTGQPSGSAPLGESQSARRSSLLGQNQVAPVAQGTGQASLDKDTLRDMLLE